MINLKLAKILLVFLIIGEFEASIPATLDPLQRDVATAIDLSLQLRILSTDLIDRMAGRHVVLIPSFIHGFFLLMKLADILDRTLQNGPLVLIAVGDKLRDLVDALIDSFTPTTFNWKLVSNYARDPEDFI